MKVYVVECHLNDWPDNGGGFQGIVGVYDSEKKAKEFLPVPNLFGEIPEPGEGEIYYEYYEYEVE